MAQIVHAHEIFNILEQGSQAFTKRTLEKEVIHRFGEDVLFENCKGEQFTFDEAIDFMLQRDKLTLNDEGVFIKGEEAC